MNRDRRARLTTHNLTLGRAAANTPEFHSIGGARLIVSAAMHVAAAAVALFLYQVRPPAEPRAPFRAPERLVAVISVPEMPELPPLPPLPKPEEPPVAKLETRTPEPMPELAAPLPPRPVESLKPAVAPPPPKETPVEPPPVPQPKPAPQVVVGAFATNTTTAPSPTPVKQVETVAFDAPAQRPSVQKPATAAAAGFDQPSTPVTRSNPQSQVAAGGFDRAAATAAGAPHGQVIRETGFGMSNSQERPRTIEKPAVTSSGFDAAPPAQQVAKTAAPARPTVVPVEVVSKPRPVYTDEARKLKIEGNVVLDVEFAASGAIRVLGVLRGLGYGLDEAAVRAAQQIEFKPARDDSGRPIDVRTTVQIVFRLA